MSAYFIIFSIIGLLGTAAFSFQLYVSIQHGQWLDKLLNWQKRLIDWDMKGKTLLTKIGGGCEVCFCNFIAELAFWPYFIFMQVNGWWFDVNGWKWWLISFIWFFIYNRISGVLSLLFIKKLFGN